MPDNRQRIQKATRFFARPVTFDLECPACGEVYKIRQAGSSSQRRTAEGVYDWTTSRFTCRRCEKAYVIGLLAWPIGPAPNVASATPRDQVPNLRQLAGLRKEGQGFWLPEQEKITRAVPDETNLTGETNRKEGEAKYDDDPDEL